MRRDKKRKTMQETLSSLDAVLTALDSYPNLEDALLEKAQGELNKYMGKLFPTQLDFSIDILEHLVGTDVLIEILSKFLTVALPGVELSLKSVLLANMQNLGTNCTIDPFIYEKAVKEGILFDLRQIDLYDKLTVSPLDKKIGQYYYFGIDDCESAYDVLQSAIDPNNQSESRKKAWGEKHKKDGQPTQKQGTSYLNRAMNDSVGHYFGGRKRDFDCLLWYMKNKGVTRQVWGKRTSEKEDIFNGSVNVSDWVNKKGDENTVYYKITGDNYQVFTKDGYNGPEANNGTLEPFNHLKKVDYYFRIKNNFYKYHYGNPTINKISRKKIYYNEKSAHKYDIYYFKDDKWDVVEKELQNYQSIETIPTDDDTINQLKKDNFIVVNKVLYQIKKDVVVKIVTKKDRDGNKHTENVIKSIKTDECIDITKSLKNDTCLFVDYDEKSDENGKTKGELIKDGKDVTSSLPCVKNEGKKQWIKVKVTDERDINKVSKRSTVCYFEDIDGDGKYTPNVDKIMIPPYNEKGLFVNVSDKIEKYGKYTKDFGVLTLEYSPRTGNIIQSDGKPMHQQTPYDNVLHVFFGNVKEIASAERDAAENAWAESSFSNKQGQVAINQIAKLRKLHQKIWKRKKRELKKSSTNSKQKSIIDAKYNYALNYYNILLEGGLVDNKFSYEDSILGTYKGVDDINILTQKIKEINECIEKYKDTLYTGTGNNDEPDDNNDEIYASPTSPKIEFDYLAFVEFINKLNDLLKIEENHYYSIGAFSRRIAQIMDNNENLYYLKSRTVSYPEARKNYYLKRTLFEFNTDYVNSLQLFDPKVLAAQLITSLFGSATMSLMIGATASWKTELIRDVVKDMVQKQIAAEDFAVSDCFFTFTNDAYNGMLRAADLRQAGLYSQHGEENGNNKIDPSKMLEGLNDFANCADQAGQTTVIKGAIMDAAVEVSKDVYNNNNNRAINFNVNMSFVETLIMNLCTQLVMAILSPKVYLLILINLELFGLSTNFDLKAFLERFEALIRSIVKSVVDQFMQYITQEILKIVEELVQKLIKKLALEQVEMYARLIKQILMHLRMLTSCGKSLGWTQDMPQYADIVSSESSQEPINEC